MFTACGPGLGELTTEAMDGCIAARNPLFVAGRGSEALATPLPPRAEEIANNLRYEQASRIFRSMAESAEDQVTLVCALDLASRHDDGPVWRFIAQYAEHPSPDVAANARKLLAIP